jgi:DNA repair exonuclease SbcCD ATPase subunit
VAKKIVSKKSNKVKRFPYIEVAGIQNQYLDAALLQCLDKESLAFALRDEFKILKKAGILPADLKQNKLSKEDLIRLVSPHLLENYNFYNYLAQKWDNIQIKTLNNHIKVDYSSFSLEQWINQIKTLIQENDMPVFAAVNLLRFYNNGELKELIQSILDDFAVQFYYESGVQMEGYEIDWDEVDEEIVKYEDESEELDLSDEEIERKPEETLRLASRLIELVADQLTELEDTEEYKTLYEQEQERNENLTRKLEALNQEVKSKESQHQALLKENRTLSKNVDALTTKLEQTKKELGKLGLSLGEIRKEKEDFEKSNGIFERRVNTLEKEQNSIGEKVKQEVKREYDLKIILMKDEYEKRLDLLKRELDEKEKEQVQMNNDLASTELERIMKELETVKNDLRVVERERNELAEQINTLNRTEGDSQDHIFGFNEDDIEDFVDFDNKPTRN